MTYLFVRLYMTRERTDQGAEPEAPRGDRQCKHHVLSLYGPVRVYVRVSSTDMGMKHGTSWLHNHGTCAARLPRDCVMTSEEARGKRAGVEARERE